MSISVVGFGLLYWAAPETKGIPLEEVAALFGDKDDIMVYQDQIHVDHTTDKVVVADDPIERADSINTGHGGDREGV